MTIINSIYNIKNPSNVTISLADHNSNSILANRQAYAKSQALKVVSDAFKGEKKLDKQMQSIKDEINELQDKINELQADTRANNEASAKLKEEYGLIEENNDDSQKGLSEGTKESSEQKLSDEELARRSEFMQKAYYYYYTNAQNAEEIEDARRRQEANVLGFAQIKNEREKSQEMLNAQDAAEEIMEASAGETIALLTQETVEHVDEEQKKREEKAKEAEEKKKEEKKEEAKRLEKEAIQQELIESIRERASESQQTSADVKRSIARRERADAESMDVDAVKKTIISDRPTLEETQDAVNMEITNILNRLSLLSNDVKGSVIDDQL